MFFIDGVVGSFYGTDVVVFFVWGNGVFDGGVLEYDDCFEVEDCFLVGAVDGYEFHNYGFPLGLIWILSRVSLMVW